MEQPWEVERIELRTEPQAVDVWVGATPSTSFT